MSGVIPPLQHMVSWRGEGQLYSCYFTYACIYTYTSIHTLWDTLAPQHGVLWTLYAGRKGTATLQDSRLGADDRL